MFDYWFTSRDDRGLVYSCDMLRYRLEFRNDLFKDGKLRDVLCQWGRTDIKDYPLNTSEGAKITPSRVRCAASRP